MPGKVLVVDDDPSVLLSLREALNERGVSVESATDLDSAAKLLDSHQFCGMVLDLVLENSNGFDILHAIQERNIVLPTIVVSAKLPLYVREMLNEDQVKLVFPKPIDTRLVASVVLGLCGM
ncbi:MAG: response regulator [Thermoanaerobaculia bacterium]